MIPNFVQPHEYYFYANQNLQTMIPYQNISPQSFYYWSQMNVQSYVPCNFGGLQNQMVWLYSGQNPQNSYSQNYKQQKNSTKIQSDQDGKLSDEVQIKELNVENKIQSYKSNVKTQVKVQKSRKMNKRPETKNLIKNYGRSIISFILKQKQVRQRVLKKCDIPDALFVNVCKQFREHIHTISAIRYLWQSHSYAQAFRILSCEYLRKYNLHHVFNSKIEKFDIYLKYQEKIMQSLKSPADFQSLKDF